jgi:hypothetical protein
VRGASLFLLGVVMLLISRVHVGLVGPLLAVAGGLLALRGIFGAALVLREGSRRI